jgi:type IV pilus assembly protein PilB
VASPDVRRLVQQREPSERIKGIACKEGMRTLRDAALREVLRGTTTMAEVMRVTQGDV